MRQPLLAALTAAILALGSNVFSEGPAAPPPSPAVPLVVDMLGISFVRIPAGGFLMGSDEPVEVLAAAYPGLERSRFEALADEAPVHRVRIARRSR